MEDGDQIPHLILPLRPRRPPAGMQLRPDAVRLQHAVNPQPSVNLEGAQAHAAALYTSYFILYTLYMERLGQAHAAASLP